jgi:Neuraminidase (sialidase)
MPMHHAQDEDVNRRAFLAAATGLALSAALPRPLTAARNPAIKVLETKVISGNVISRERRQYHGWPTLTRRRNGQLVVVCSGGREQHVCPFGRVEMIVSNDQGATWSWPRIVLDSPIDDRDAGVLETARGTLLVTTFTSLAYEPLLTEMEARAANDPASVSADRLAAWRSAHNALSADERQAELGQWMIRSTDGGRTWSPRYASIVNSPHGPVQLADGRLLYAGKELWTGAKRVGVCQSQDDGRSWQWLADIPPREGDTIADYHELHAVETADGRLIAHIRNHNKAHAGETLQSESSDGGKTWSVPKSIAVWGLPSHLLRLKSGHLVMSYGHRRAPLGNQARVSLDHGRTWSEPLVISADGITGDLGYPSTVELDDGTLLTVWYEHQADAPSVLRQARWKLEV